MTTTQAPDFDRDEFMDDYARGMAMLRLTARAFSMMASGIGYPIANTSIPTAQVSVNVNDQRVYFEINPHFIHPLKDSEIAAVIAHETYHVMLGHLAEIADRTEYPKVPVLIDAQECIINDSLPGNVGFTTPSGTFRGMDRHGQDFSIFSTREGYDFIEKKDEDEDDSQDGEDGDGGAEGKDGEKSDSSNASGGAGGSSSSADDEKSDEDGEGSGPNGDGSEEQDSACGGPQITGDDLDEMSPEEIADAVKKAIAGAVDDAIDEMNKNGENATPEIEDMLEALDEAGITPSKQPNFGNPNADKSGFNTIDATSGLNVNWAELLTVINPKMKSFGRPKSRDSWHAPRRRMMHSYPNIILPTQRRLDDPNERKGDSVPTFIIALDMSGSIPTRLLKDLAAFAQSIPEKLIKAFPITWSDHVRVFDPEQPNKICSRGGTRLESVYQYANQIKAAEGVDPYVLVITDGGYYVPNSMDASRVLEKWWWMAIEPNDRSSIIRNTGAHTTPERVFTMRDFV